MGGSGGGGGDLSIRLYDIQVVFISEVCSLEWTVTEVKALRHKFIGEPNCKWWSCV